MSWKSVGTKRSPALAVYADRRMRFNAGAVELLGTPEAVVFFADGNRIGIKPVDRSDRSARCLRAVQGGLIGLVPQGVDREMLPAGRYTIGDPVGGVWELFAEEDVDRV